MCHLPRLLGGRILPRVPRRRRAPVRRAGRSHPISSCCKCSRAASDVAAADRGPREQDVGPGQFQARGRRCGPPPAPDPRARWPASPTLCGQIDLRGGVEDVGQHVLRVHFCQDGERRLHPVLRCPRLLSRAAASAASISTKGPSVPPSPSLRASGLNSSQHRSDTVEALPDSSSTAASADMHSNSVHRSPWPRARCAPVVQRLTRSFDVALPASAPGPDPTGNGGTGRQTVRRRPARRTWPGRSACAPPAAPGTARSRR